MSVNFLPAAELSRRIALAGTGSARPITFMIGSAASTPRHQGGPGVPSVTAMLDLVQERLGEELPPGCSYQQGFEQLVRAQGLDAVNAVIR